MQDRIDDGEIDLAEWSYDPLNGRLRESLMRFAQGLGPIPASKRNGEFRRDYPFIDTTSSTPSDIFTNPIIIEADVGEGLKEYAWNYYTLGVPQFDLPYGIHRAFKYENGVVVLDVERSATVGMHLARGTGKYDYAISLLRKEANDDFTNQIILDRLTRLYNSATVQGNGRVIKLPRFSNELQIRAE